MASTLDELIAGFPHSILPKVTGEPTFEDLKITRRLLNANAMIISSYEGGRRHGHLGIIMTNAEYFVVAIDVFLPPKNPRPAATIVAGMMSVQISEIVWLQTAVTHIYRKYNNVDQAFKKMIIDASEDQYLNALSNEIVSYANCMSLQLLTHLLMYYAMIAPTELTQNYERLNPPYDPNQPIKNLFQRIQDARAFAVDGGQPYGDVMIVNVAFTLVFNTGLFPDACRAWPAWSIAYKTWLQFKIDFAAAHREFLLNNQTAQQPGFHSANMMIEQGRGDTMQDTVDVIEQLATTTAPDHRTVATLTVNNSKLASQLEAAQAYLEMLKDEIISLKAKINPARKGQRPAKSTNNNNYCLSHGHQVHKDHTSVTCKARTEWHQEMATKDNTMGGVAWGGMIQRGS
jgi:hypothetical protein